MSRARVYRRWPAIALATILFPLTAAADQTSDDRLLAAVRHGDRTAAAAALADGADPDASTRTGEFQGKTALMWAADQGDTAMIDLLLAGGAQVDRTNPRGGTALMYAAVESAPAAVSRLLAAGAAVDHQVANGWSALMLATVKNRRDNVRHLIGAGADIDMQDIQGWTPLMRATEQGNREMVDLLLSLGADPAASGATVTAADIAMQLGFTEIAERLRAAAP